MMGLRRSGVRGRDHVVGLGSCDHLLIAFEAENREHGGGVFFWAGTYVLAFCGYWTLGLLKIN